LNLSKGATSLSRSVATLDNVLRRSLTRVMTSLIGPQTGLPMLEYVCTSISILASNLFKGSINGFSICARRSNFLLRIWACWMRSKQSSALAGAQKAFLCSGGSVDTNFSTPRSHALEESGTRGIVIAIRGVGAVARMLKSSRMSSDPPRGVLSSWFTHEGEKAVMTAQFDSTSEFPYLAPRPSRVSDRGG